MTTGVQTIESCIPEIAFVVTHVNGINGAQSTPRENESSYPFAMVYLLDGEVMNDVTQGIIDLHNIAVDLLVPRIWDLADSLPMLHPILDNLKNALWSEVATSSGSHFNTSIDTFSNLRIQFLPEYPYAGTDLIGYRLIMEGVKLMGVL